MATAEAIHRTVTSLFAAHGRAPADESFDAYQIALGDYTDPELASALVSALREPREFVPPASIVAKFASDARNARLRHTNTVDDRRLHCAICQDRGHVIILNRKWLLEHRDAFTPEWFVEGWMQQAAAWCRNNNESIDDFAGRKAMFYCACCFCDSPSAKVYRAQAERYLAALRDGTWDEKKIPRPAFGLLYDRDLDCMTESRSSADVQAAVMAWTENDRDGRTWSGNWNP